MGCGTSKEEAIAVVNDAIDAVQNGALNHHPNNSNSTVNNKDNANDPIEAEKPPPSESPPEEDPPAPVETNPESSSFPDQNPSDSDNGNDTSAVPEANETTPETTAPEGESEAGSEQTNENSDEAVLEVADEEEKAGSNQEDNAEAAEATETVEASEITTAESEIDNANVNDGNGAVGTLEENASAPPQSDISGECNDGDVHISTPSPTPSQSSICGTRGNSVEDIDPEEDEGTVLDGNCNENDPAVARMDSTERLIPADEGLEEAIENDFSEEGEKLKRSESRSSETSVNSTNSSPKTVRSSGGSPNGVNEENEDDEDSGVVCEKKENEIENEGEEEVATGSSASSDCIEDEEDVGKDDVVPKEALMIVAGSPTIMERRKGLFG